ncbi:MAG: hypothetical protein IKB27_06455 [Clostridia bacterium]|nr:hypothetical protein [Clostridia bacterium]
MKRFMYKIIHMSEIPDDERKREYFFNELGLQGWELIQCVNQTALHYYMIFKKEI